MENITKEKALAICQDEISVFVSNDENVPCYIRMKTDTAISFGHDRVVAVIDRDLAVALKTLLEK